MIDYESNLEESKKASVSYKSHSKPKGRGPEHTTVGVSSVKPKSVTQPNTKLNVRGLINRFKGLSPRAKFITVAAAGIASMMVFSRHTNYSPKLNISRNTHWDDNSSAYIPEKYLRGYDTIKENMTDFGSRVHLSKTVMKTLSKSFSSTRQSTVRTVNSVIRSNPVLSINPIGHNRY